MRRNENVLRQIKARFHNNMSTAVHSILNFLFPPSDLDQQIQKLTPQTLIKRMHIREDPEQNIIFFRYRDPLIKHLILCLKYKKYKRGAELFGDILGDYLIESVGEKMLFDNFESLLIVPIPLSTERLRERGYNQVEQIISALLKNHPEVGTPAFRALIKTRGTRSQTDLPRAERLKNLSGAFMADSSIVAGKSIILIDDVVTTGSTLREARDALYKAGARNIVSIALAS